MCEPCTHSLPAFATASAVAATAVDLEDAAVDRCTASMVAGDRTAYETLFRGRCGFVEREARRRVGRRADLADDVVQEAWMRVARGPRRCESAASLDAWLRRIVRSAAIDLLRSELSRRVRERRVAESRSEAADFIDDFELFESLRRDTQEIDGITSEEQALLELRVRAGGSLAQLAAMLGIGAAAIDSKLRRAAERARAHRGNAGTSDQRRTKP